MTAALALLLLVAVIAYARRGALRRWWRTMPCPHPDCFGRLPTTPLYPAVGLPVPEQCSTCEGWVRYDLVESRYRRVLPPELTR